MELQTTVISSPSPIRSLINRAEFFLSQCAHGEPFPEPFSGSTAFFIRVKKQPETALDSLQIIYFLGLARAAFPE